MSVQQQKERHIPVSECFQSIQGEGALIGKPTIFIRVGGCDYRCRMCDTQYAVLPTYRADWMPMTIEEIFAEVQRLSDFRPMLCTLSGGNPAMYPLGALIDLGHQHGYHFSLETQGSIPQDWFMKLSYLTLSPKLPGMGNPWPTNWERFEKCLAAAWAVDPAMGPQICLKLVIFDETDYHSARALAERYPALPVYLQAGNHSPSQVANEIDLSGILSRLNWLIDRVLQDRWYNAVVLPQLHTLLWGNTRGV